MTTIDELYQLTNVTRKQVNNRVNKLKCKYPNFIMGGGKGKGGKYKIDPLFFKYLTRLKPHQSKPNQVINRNNNHSSVNWENFSNVKWDWFGCVSTTSVFEVEQLLNLINLKDGELLFYSVHSLGRLDELHLHFISNSELMPSKQFKNQNGIITNIKINKFRDSLKRECYEYFTNFAKTRDRNQLLIEYGFLIGYLEKKQLKKMYLT